MFLVFLSGLYCFGFSSIFFAYGEPVLMWFWVFFCTCGGSVLLWLTFFALAADLYYCALTRRKFGNFRTWKLFTARGNFAKKKTLKRHLTPWQISLSHEKILPEKKISFTRKFSNFCPRKNKLNPRKNLKMCPRKLQTAREIFKKSGREKYFPPEKKTKKSA